MNRDKALLMADRIMTRIESDRAIHKDAIADEIQAADALDEIIDVISHDGAVFDVEKSHERFLAEGFVAGVPFTPDELMKIMSRAVWEMPLPVNRIKPKKTA